jgi:tetratricopeptide (TPR) repeat protein
LAQTSTVRQMIPELAARMFADLELQQSQSWQAARRFLEGLRHYRSAQESQQDRVLKLRRALRSFVEALADDENTLLARYNLGVAYRELGFELDRIPKLAGKQDFAKAAENAFRRELERESPGWQPYYALAVTYFEAERFADVSSLCDRVIELADDPARKAIAYDLRGLADRRRETVHPQLALALAINSRRRAVAYALLALLREELAGKDPAPARSLLARCLLNLGIGLAFEALGQDASTRSGAARRRRSYAESRSHLCSAARLENSFDPHFQLGKIAIEFAEPNVAVREFRAAVRIAPTSASCWAWLAATNAALYEGAAPTDARSAAEWKRRAEDAIRLARANLNVDSRPERDETVEQIALAFEHLGDPAEAARAVALPHVEASLLEEPVDALVGRLEDETDPWTRGQIAARLGRLHREAGAHDESERYFHDAIDALAEYPGEIRRCGLRGMVALAVGAQGDLQRALVEAQAAISVDPTSWWERQVFGDIYAAIGDLENAVAAYEDALSWRPSDPASLHTALGRWHLALAEASPDSARRTELHRRGIRHLQDALALQWQGDLSERLAAHYSLGSAYTDADDYERAVPHLVNALAADKARPIVQLMLGQAFVRLKRYGEAEEILAAAIATAESEAAEDPRREILDPAGTPWIAAALAGAAHRIRALSFIERDARLPEARKHVEESDRLLEPLGDDASAAWFASGRELEGRILLAEGQHDRAIAALNDSIGLAADVEAYVHLARAYAAEVAGARSAVGRRRAVELGRRAAGHAQDLDRSTMYAAVIGELLVELAPAPTGVANGGSPAS